MQGDGIMCLSKWSQRSGLNLKAGDDMIMLKFQGNIVQQTQLDIIKRTFVSHLLNHGGDPFVKHTARNDRLKIFQVS